MLTTKIDAFVHAHGPRMANGAIVTGAVLGALGGSLPDGRVVALTVLIDPYLICVAGSYAGTMREQLISGQPLPTREIARRSLTPDWFVSSSLVPAVLFVGVSFGWLSQQAAWEATRAILIVLVLAVAFVARRLGGAGIYRSLLSSVTFAGICYLAMRLKIWANMLPTLEL